MYKRQLPLATKLFYRAEKFGYEIPTEHPVKISATTEEELGKLLLGIVDQAVALGLDPEAALRGATKDYIAKIQKFEGQ